ncbi:hypothetical protein JCM10213_008161 [Rhodosporidiobolus nylandii]
MSGKTSLVLPADLYPLILEHLAAPVGFAFPPHYAHLRTAALVCKDWVKMAQKLLWREVYLDGEDEAMKRFVEARMPDECEVEALVLDHEQSSEWYHEVCQRDPETMLEVFQRCPRILCLAFPLNSALHKVPAPLPAYFTDLEIFESSWAYRDVISLGCVILPKLDTFRLGNTNPSGMSLIISELVRDHKNALLPSLRTLGLPQTCDLRSLLPLASTLHTLEVPARFDDALPYEYPDPLALGMSAYLVDVFLPACTSLKQLVLEADWPPGLLLGLPPTVKRLDILNTRKDMLTMLEQFAGQGEPTSLEVLCLRDRRAKWKAGWLYEASERVRELGAVCGIKVEV